MKKELIGISICTMLIAIAFVPNITAHEDIASTSSLSEALVLSEEEYIELRDKISELNDQLLAADTVEQAEKVIREVITLLDDYNLLPADTTVDQEVESMKTCYIEQNKLENQLVTMQNNQMLYETTVIEDEMVQGEITESTMILREPQPLLSPTGWSFLVPCLNRFPIGFEIIGEAWGSESFNSLSIAKTRYSGFVYFLFGGRPIKIKNSNLVLEYWYLVYGVGQFDVTCTWTWNGKGYHTGGRFKVTGLRVEIVIT